MLTILNVAYGLAPVSEDVAGGAEQVLLQLDRALVRAGHHSLVIAAAGSRVAGQLLAVPAAAGPITPAVRERTHAAQRALIKQALDRWPVDVVHMHGIDFFEYLPPAGVPVLITLHLPLSWYPAAALRPERPAAKLVCVSHAQRALADAELAEGLGVIPNGVPVSLLPRPDVRCREWLLSLGRICPEKGFHLALSAAYAARASLFLAGSVFAYPEHQRYFREQIVPRLDAQRRYVPGANLRRKRRLLSGARALLVPSLVPETSSLVAMEALACGTPVIAFDTGALSELVIPGRTGMLVHDAAEMSEAIGAVSQLSSAECAAFAREHCASERMVGRYLAAYHALARALPFDHVA